MVWWVALGAVVAILVIGVPLALSNVRAAQRRSAPHRVRATVIGTPKTSTGGGLLELTVRFEQPGRGPVLVTLREPTVARAYLPKLDDRSTVAVFASPHDPDAAQLDWSAFGTRRTVPDQPALEHWAPLSPKEQEQAKATAVQWQMTCTTCAYTRSLWEAGGIGGPWLRLGTTNARCPACAGMREHRLWRPTGT